VKDLPLSGTPMAFAVGGSATGIASAAVFILRKQGIIKKSNSDSSGSPDHRI
jgi:hypothetical protein